MLAGLNWMAHGRSWTRDLPSGYAPSGYFVQKGIFAGGFVKKKKTKIYNTHQHCQTIGTPAEWLRHEPSFENLCSGGQPVKLGNIAIWNDLEFNSLSNVIVGFVLAINIIVPEITEIIRKNIR